MKLSQLIASLDVIECINYNGNLEISHLAYNSKYVINNTLFFAIRGLKSDGHDYISSAITKGAVCIVFNQEQTHYEKNITYIKVKNPRHALGNLSSEFYGRPSQKMVITGVTGTNGKTSTTMMLKHIFETAKHKCGLIGTINNQIGKEILENNGKTTPDSLEIQEILSKMYASNCTDVMMEVSSHGLDLDRVNGVDFDYAIFTNLTQDHLDYHKTFQNYFEAKAKLFNFASKCSITNIDNDWGEVLYNRLKAAGKPVISYSQKRDADYCAINPKYTDKGTFFTLILPDKEKHAFFLSLSGEFMVANALPTIALALMEGIPISIIKTALATMKTVEGRMEKLDLPCNFDVIIDYAHTPDGLLQLLKSVRKIYSGKLFLVFGCNGDRDKEKRPIMGQIAGKYADHIIVTSDNPASENPMSIIDVVATSVKNVNPNCETVEKRWDAIYYAATLPKAGDVLVLAGKGHEKQETMKDVNLYYNEWDTAEEAIRRLNEKL